MCWSKSATTAGVKKPIADGSAGTVLDAWTENGDVEYHFDYDAYVQGDAPGTNVVLQAGDTVVVPD